MCAVEIKRGCGWRKAGGTYLVGGGIGVPCDRLPLLLETCPTCGHGIKYSRGWTWMDVGALVQGWHSVDEDTCPEVDTCLFCGRPETMGRAGLLWVGEQFYKTPAEFVAEGQALGFSRRIRTVPRGFEIGKTWVLLAHIKAVEEWKPALEPMGALLQEIPGIKERHYKPGIFYVWLPTGIEKIMLESQRGSEEAAANEKKGYINVFVPDGDPDHTGTVFDKDEQQELFNE